MCPQGIASVQTRTRHWILGLWALAMLLAVITLFMVLSTLQASQGRYFGFRGAFLIFAVPTSITGVLILWRYPRHTIGWLILWIGLGASITALLNEYFFYALVLFPGTLPAGNITAWLASWVWAPALFPMMFIPLLFPDGHLLSRRWWPVALLGSIYLIWAVLYSAFLPGPLPGISPPIDNPFGIQSRVLPQWVFAINPDLLVVVVLLAGVVSLIVRFRRSRGVERQQLKWFVFAVAIVALTSPFVLSGVDILLSVAIISWAFPPIAVAISILRYRLYDIDLIIRRTLIYSLLTVTLAMVYFGSVMLLQSLITTVGGQQSAIAVVLSTLAIAALFTPLHRRVQATIDHRFYRRKFNAELALTTFASAARDEVDVKKLTTALIGVVEETLQPEQISLWLAADKHGRKP